MHSGSGASRCMGLLAQLTTSGKRSKLTVKWKWRQILQLQVLSLAPKMSKQAVMSAQFEISTRHMRRDRAASECLSGCLFSVSGPKLGRNHAPSSQVKLLLAWNLRPSFHSSSLIPCVFSLSSYWILPCSSCLPACCSPGLASPAVGSFSPSSPSRLSFAANPPLSSHFTSR